MAALFAYLIAIGVFLAGGYAGLVWLTEPPSAPPAVHSVASQPHQASPDPAGSRHLTTGSAAARDEAARLANATRSSDQAQREAARASDQAQQQTARPPRQGCVPIGLTAGGDLVFPIECRDRLGPDHSGAATTKQADAAPTPQQAQQAPAAPAQRSAEATPSPNNAELGDRTNSAARKPPSTDEKTAIARNGNATRRARPSTGPIRDSRNEERPPTMGRSRTVASQSDEWFNPLGLR